MKEGYPHILERLNKSKPEPVDLETLRQGYPVSEEFMPDVKDLVNDHRIAVVGPKLHREVSGDRDTVTGQVKITAWG
jgi:hypothetical protein